ncbi:MAG: transporter substrate-binding domain-containing protein [Clostridia bacterium]|nr:transporter substrate-binding domain-containing protein [Clostridia bacterium]
MKKFIKILMASVLAVATLFCFTACKDSESIVDVTPNQITVGYTVYSPMNYTDENGVFCGFDTELALRVFGALGYDVKFREIDWANKYVELNNGTVDCVWNGFTRNSTDKNDAGDVVSREELCDFSIDYMVNGQVLISKSAKAITDLSGLNGKSLAYETNSAADSLINGEESDFAGLTINKANLPYQINAAEQVMNGSKDYAVIDVILAKDLIANNPAYSDVVINDIDLGVEYYAIAFKTGSSLTAKVNAMLVAFAQVGYLTELATKYGVESSLITSWN